MLLSRIREYIARHTSSFASVRKAYPRTRLAGRRLSFPIPRLQSMQYLPSLLSPGEKKIASVSLIASMLALCTMGVIWIVGSITITPARGGTYSEAIIGAPQYINPLFDSTNDADQDITRLIFSSLFVRGPKGIIVPDLATDYQISEDTKNYTIRIHDNVRWHDGTRLTADDVIFTVLAAQNSGFPNSIKDDLATVTVQKNSDTEILFSLATPNPHFINLLTFGILPKHIWQDIMMGDPRLSEYNIRPVGSGPFMFDTFTKDKKTGTVKTYTVSRFKDYFGAAPYLDSVTFVFFPAYEEALNALKNNQVEGVAYVPRAFSQGVRSMSRIAMRELSLPVYTALFFNTKSPLLTDAKVRTALANSIPTDTIRTSIFGDDATQARNQLLDPALPDTGYPYDPAAGAQVLQNLGWSKNSEGVLEQARTKTQLTLTLVTSTESVYQEIAARIAQVLTDQGVQVTVAALEPIELTGTTIPNRAYDMLLYGVALGEPATLFPVWHSSQATPTGLNVSGFGSRTTDSLIEASLTAPTTDQAREQSQKVLETIQSQAPAVLLYSPLYDYAVNNSILGVHTTHIATPSDRLSDITKRYIRTTWKLF